MEIRSKSPTSSWVYSQRLVMFARETIEYARKIKQYSDNLVPLAQVAFDPAAKKELRRRALAICKKHAKELQKYTEKLNDNLSKALPMASGQNTRAESIDKEIPANGSPFALAALLAGESKDLSNGVYRLIFPTDHSVTLEDLKNPPLIRSLEKIQVILARFRGIANESSIV